jgi:hypothetical protein
MIRLATSRLRSPLPRRLIPQSAFPYVATIHTRNVPRIARVGGGVGTRALGTVMGAHEDTITTRPALRWASGMAVLLVAAGTVSGASALCEKDDADAKADASATTAPGPDANADISAAPGPGADAAALVSTDTVEEEEEEDPYENLPDEDEETSCSMCNTFRKGPCRPTWRKLERCFKDHEDEENGAVKCMRYFKPHSDCLMDYTNLYHLISLEMKQEFVQDVQVSVTAEERQTWAPAVDWSNWIMFAKDAGLSFQQTIPVEDKTTPLWQRLPADTEPVIITVSANLPKQKHENGLILKAAYALDQDGMVLGFTFNKDYADKLHEVNDRLSKTKEAEASTEVEAPTATSSSENETATATSDEKETAPITNKEEEKEETLDPTVMPFEFFLLPGSTKQVRVCALYAEDPVTAPATKDILDALLMESTTISLADVSEQAPSIPSQD